MRLVVGLGNPGARYAATRHNVGWRVLDRWVEAHHGAPWRGHFDGLVSEVVAGSVRVLALKPQKFMNRSGGSVRQAAGFFKIPPEEVLIVHDEVDLAFGDVRLKVAGGEAGHNGLRSVSAELGTPNYARLRCGVGRPPPDFRGDTADYVLQAFPPAQQAEVETLISRAISALEAAIELGMSQAMNRINRKPKT